MAPVKSSSPAEVAFLEKKSSIELAKLYNSSANKESAMSVTIKSILDARGFDPSIAETPAKTETAAEAKTKAQKAQKAKKAAESKAIENIADTAEVAASGVYIAPEMTLTPEQEEAQRLHEEAVKAEREAKLAAAMELEAQIHEAQGEVDAAKKAIEDAREFLKLKMESLKALQTRAKELKITVPKGSDTDIAAIRAQYRWAIGERVLFAKNGSDELIEGEIKAIDYDKRVGMALFRIIGQYKIYHKRIHAVTFLNQQAGVSQAEAQAFETTEAAEPQAFEVVESDGDGIGFEQTEYVAPYAQHVDDSGIELTE